MIFPKTDRFSNQFWFRNKSTLSHLTLNTVRIGYLHTVLQDIVTYNLRLKKISWEWTNDSFNFETRKDSMALTVITANLAFSSIVYAVPQPHDICGIWFTFTLGIYILIKGLTDNEKSRTYKKLDHLECDIANNLCWAKYHSEK